MIIDCGHPRRVFVFKLTFARIASFFRTLPKTEVEMTKKTFVHISPRTSKTLVEKLSNSLNSLIDRLGKGDLVEKDILVRNMVSNLSFPQVPLLVSRVGHKQCAVVSCGNRALGAPSVVSRHIRANTQKLKKDPMGLFEFLW